MFRASVVFSLTLPPPQPSPAAGFALQGRGLWFTYTWSAQVFVNGWSCCMGNVSAASNPIPALPHGGRGPFGLCFGHRWVSLALPPPQPTPGPHAKCRRILRGYPPAAGFALQERGFWFTYTWSAQVYVNGWSCCMDNVSAASNPTPALPHGGGSSSGYVSGIGGCSSGATLSLAAGEGWEGGERYY